MASETITYETSRPAKTFGTNTYLFLGIIFTALGAYYFGTQSNWERPEEYIPLGIIFMLGLYFIVGYTGKWALPKSKPYYEKSEFFINSETNELIYRRTFNQNQPHTFVVCSLDGVESFDYKVESKTTTSRVGTMEDSYGSGLGHTMPTGLNYKYRNVTTTCHTNYLILLPSKEKTIVSSSISNMSYFVQDLNELIAKQNSPTSPQSL
jgi:hypothetical protein